MTTETRTHTPGPWKAEITPRENNVYAAIQAEDGPCIGVAYFRDGDGWGGPSREEMEANAKLMAAAPELLAALTRYVDCDGHEDVIKEQAQAAIEKAIRSLEIDTGGSKQ